MRAKFTGLFLIVSLLFATTVQAGFVNTEQTHALQQQQQLLSAVEQQLAQDSVRKALATLGVGESEIQARIAALSPAELAQVHTQLEQLPAGAGIVEVVGVVFIVLVILELVGVTDIFNAF